MVKVTLGELAGERAEGYEFYRTGGPTGAGQTIRRALATSPFQHGGGTRYQGLHSLYFSMANTIYNGFSDLEKCFFRGWALRIEEPAYNQPTTYKALTGKALAIHDIMDSLEHLGTAYPRPLGFCICAIDAYDNPVSGTTLTVVSEKTGIITYEGESDLCGCFPACSVSPKHEPYRIICGHAAYGPYTAQEVHDLRYLCIWDKNQVFYRPYYSFSVGGALMYRGIWTFNFNALGWTEETKLCILQGEMTENDWTGGIHIGTWSGIWPQPVCGKDFYTGSTGPFKCYCTVKNGYQLYCRCHAPLYNYNFCTVKDLEIIAIG